MSCERTINNHVFKGRCYGGPWHLRSAGCMVPVLQVPIRQPSVVPLYEADAVKLPEFNVCTYRFEKYAWPGRVGLSIGLWRSENYDLTRYDKEQLCFDAVTSGRLP